jgi:hypothetical protein
MHDWNFDGKTVSNEVRLRNPQNPSRSRGFGIREAAARRLILRKADTATDAAAEKCPREKWGRHPDQMKFNGSEQRCAEGKVWR